jgi:hypothetical protein
MVTGSRVEGLRQEFRAKFSAAAFAELNRRLAEARVIAMPEQR